MGARRTSRRAGRWSGKSGRHGRSRAIRRSTCRTDVAMHQRREQVIVEALRQGRVPRLLHPHVEVVSTWEGQWPYSSSCECAIAVDHRVTASSQGTNDRSGRDSETPRTIVSRCGEDTTGARRAGCDGDRVVPYAHDVVGTNTVHESSPVVQRDLRPAACTRVVDDGHQREEPASSRSRSWRTRRTNSRSATGASNTVAPSSV
jgi:hypothetical protein